MRLRDFLKDRIAFIAVQALCVGFVCFFMHVLGVGGYTVLFVAALFLLADAGVLLLTFWHRREFYQDMLSKLENLPQKYLLLEMIDEPSFLEGHILYQVLRQTDKAMNDHIAAFRTGFQDYREYIEQWVHEIKTPIAAAKLTAQNHPSAASNSMLQDIERIEALVEQTLFYARCRSVEKDYILGKVTLKELVHQSLKKHAAMLIGAHMGLELKNLDFTVYTDPKWMDFILGQLLTNAVQYRQEENARLVLEGEENPDSVMLRVRDNGIGILPQELPRVFERGFCGTNGRRKKASTGMGLYLCKTLCEKLGLSIAAASNGQGTVIQIVFPKSRMHLLEP